jgi:hypothetical protein
MITMNNGRSGCRTRSMRVRRLATIKITNLSRTCLGLVSPQNILLDYTAWSICYKELAQIHSIDFLIELTEIEFGFCPARVRHQVLLSSIEHFYLLCIGLILNG